MSFEIVLEELEYNENNNTNYIPFLKWNYNNTFKLNKFKNNIKSLKQYEVSLNKNIHSNLDIKKLSGIIEKNKLNEQDKLKEEDTKKEKNKLKEEFVDNLIPYSFILQAKIKLNSPYFSRDDDNFYLIQNPCLKDKVFKVPMIRGSGWKGVIANAGKELINEKLNNDTNSNSHSNQNDLSIKDSIQSYLRIFGTGSQEFREFEKTIEEFVKKSTNLAFEKVLFFLLFDLGIKLKADDINDLKDENKIVEWIKDKFWEKLTKNSNEKIPVYLKTHKGRAIFYPTYFDKLSLEIINPHSRKTRAGTNPIHYEVVPKDTEGILQIVYIPFDGVLTKDKDLKSEVENDIKFLTQCIKKAADIGIGAKEKLGWGRFNLVYKKAKCNKDDVKIPEEWKNE